MLLATGIGASICREVRFGAPRHPAVSRAASDGAINSARLDLVRTVLLLVLGGSRRGYHVTEMGQDGYGQSGVQVNSSGPLGFTYAGRACVLFAGNVCSMFERRCSRSDRVLASRNLYLEAAGVGRSGSQTTTCSLKHYIDTVT
jgi:hypothetical protein